MSTKFILFISLLVYSFSISENIKGSDTSDHYSSHHLLDDEFDGLSNEEKFIFISAAKQLKTGKFDKFSHRGMLLYGPDQEGKKEMIEAMASASDSHVLRVKASELVSRYQGSGARAIKAIFDQAKILKANKGVLILIDKLQSLSPETTKNDRCDGLARENRNTLAQLRREYDNCERNKDPILVVATCDNLWKIDKGTRGRLTCIEFPYPNNMSLFEISKHDRLTRTQNNEENIRNSIRNKKCYSKAIKKKD